MYVRQRLFLVRPGFCDWKHRINYNLKLSVAEHFHRSAKRLSTSKKIQNHLFVPYSLFLRGATGLVPTLRADDLAEPIAQTLRQIESAWRAGAVHTSSHLA